MSKHELSPTAEKAVSEILDRCAKEGIDPTDVTHAVSKFTKYLQRGKIEHRAGLVAMTIILAGVMQEAKERGVWKPEEKT